jgi:hypothetical protein
LVFSPLASQCNTDPKQSTIAHANKSQAAVRGSS